MKHHSYLELMYVDVIPFARLPKHLKYFTYQSNIDLQAGHFVKIPWKSGYSFGVVVNTHNNKPKFPVKDISELVEEVPSWNKTYLKAILEYSEKKGTSPSLMAKQFSPSIPQKKHKPSQNKKDNNTVILPHDIIEKKTVSEINNIKAVTQTIEYNHQSERLLMYRSLAKKVDGQLLIICPQVVDTIEVYSFLNKYFPNQIILWDFSKNKNEQWNNWQDIKNNSPKIVVTTKSGLLLPLKDLALIIIDQSDADEHKQWEAQPMYDVRELSQQLSTPIISTSLAPKKEPDLKLSSKPGPIHIYYHERKDVIIHPDIDISGFTFLLTHNKSFAKTYFCLDCQHQWFCPQCKRNLHIKNNLFYCSNCDYKAELPTSCPNCSSQRIKPFGLGIEGLQKELKITTQIFTKDHPKLDLNTPSLVLCTKHIYNYLRLNPVKNSRLIYYHPEDLLYIPRSDMNYQFYKSIQQARSFANDYLLSDLIIQTTLKPEHFLLEKSLLKDRSSLDKLEESFYSKIN